MKLFYIIVCCLFFSSCGGASKKMTLDKEVVEPVEEVDVFVPQAGVKYSEIRGVDPNNLPITIPMDTELPKVKSLNLEAKQIRLSHPNKKEFFILQGKLMMQNNFKMFLINTLNVRAIVGNNYMLVGDPFTGLHCYATDGTFLYTINPESPSLPEDRSDVSLDMNAVKNLLLNFSMIDDICFYSTNTEGVVTHHIYNLKEKKIVKKANQDFNNPWLLNSKSNSILDDVYKGLQGEGTPAMIVSQLGGDTICVFNNYNAAPQVSSTYYGFRPSTAYYFDNRLTINHIANDTLFIVESENRLLPQYVFNFGTKKATLQNYVLGTLEGKITVNNIQETKDFLILHVTHNGKDKSDAKKQKAICYNKKTKNFFELEDLAIKNSPLSLKMFSSENGKLTRILSHSSLQKIPPKVASEISASELQAFEVKYPDIKDTNDIVVLIVE